MFLRISRNRRGKNTYEYAQIAERYHVNGKQKTRILEYLGPVRNEKDLDQYRKALLLAQEKESVLRSQPDEITLLPALDYGIMYVSMLIMRETGILDVIRKNTSVYSNILAFMIMSRLLEPLSDLNLIDLHNRIYYPWAEIELNDDNIYRALDRILLKKNSIEEQIFMALKPDTTMVHYDLTSTYFEGREDNDLVLFGYSRDKKRGKEQIVIGLVMADGIPIHHEVWPGNTVDPKTLESTLSVLKERFHIRNAIFIGDRAFGRSSSLVMLDHNLFITAAYRWDNPYRDILMNTDFSDGVKSGDLIIKEVSVGTDDLLGEDVSEDEKNLVKKRRHIAVYNKEREKLDIADLEDKISIVNMKISEIHDVKDLKKSLGKLKSLVKFTTDGVILNERRIGILRKIAGRFLIVTNTDLPMDQVVSSYKEQWMIERSFRTLKTFIEIRPVNHRKSDRIKAHVFVCVLSLLVSRLIERRAETTISSVAGKLSYLKVTPVQTSSGTVMIRSESQEAKQLLNKMKIDYPEKVVGARIKKE